MRGVVRSPVLMLATIGAVAVSVAFAASASAASIVVTSTADPGGTSSQCTLRQAIDSANSDATPSGSNCTAGSGTDTITFAQSILPAHITLSGGELAPATNMTIQGPTADPS
jgi:CSLREA domain-containing protein